MRVTMFFESTWSTVLATTSAGSRSSLADNWEYLTELDPPSPQGVDFFHGAEHLQAALSVA